MRPPLLLLALLLLPAAAPPPAVPAYRAFGRWLVACDNTRSCVARGFDEVTRAQLELVRAAGPAAPRLSLSAEDPVDPAALRLDGAPLPVAGWSRKENTLSTGDAAAVDAFVAVARNGRAITLDAGPAKDDAPRTVPLDGFTAALLFVDAVQGRSGTPTALVASRGPAAVPPALPVPAAPSWSAPPPLSAAERTRLTQVAARLRSPIFEPCSSKEKPSVTALDANNALAIRPCETAAYQGSAVVAVLPRAGGTEKPVKLALPGLPRDATSGPDMVDPVFEATTGTLFTSAKGRGPADCGSSAAWVWSNGAFRLKSLNFQEQCGGTEPGDWPTLFRTR